MAAVLDDNRRLDELLASNQIDDVSRARIEAATRHCRLGADGRAYQDMLLSWWMGLETLTSPGEGKGIGARVFKNAVPVLCHGYFKYHVRHLCEAVKAAVRSWPTEVCTLLGCQPDQTLGWREFLTVLQDSSASAAISTALATNPWVEIQFRRLAVIASEPLKHQEYLAQHAERVKWHLMRQYRIRCCLVHGTPITAALQLPAANLEFYLREVILVVINALQRASQLKSVDMVFERVRYASERRTAILTERNANIASILAAVDVDLTF